VIEQVSKENRRKSKASQAAAGSIQSPTTTRKLTPEEAAAVIRDRMAKRPVIVWRYPNGKWNKRFIITLGIMIAAMIAALYFFSRNY
jgi:hypothetical protein